MSHLTSPPAARIQALLLAAASLGAGFAGYALLAMIASPPVPRAPALWLAGGAGVALVATLAAIQLRRTATLTSAETAERIALSALAAAVAFLAVGTVVHYAQFLMIPADILAFSESPFVDDIIKFRLGQPIYGPVADNNTYPYTPGTQLLTYSIARLFGHPTSIPAFRIVQFSYVMLAALVGAATCHQIARGVLRPEEYRHRPLWIAIWAAVMVLLVTEPVFNLYTHALHNDGLALLVSMCGFFLIARYHAAPSAWLVAPMAVLPALGFLVKQNQLLWAGVFALYLLASGRASWKTIAIYVAACTAAVAIVVGGSIAVMGDSFRYWIFSALGDKQVSVIRSVQHLMEAGVFAAMGLFAAWVLVLPQLDRGKVALWGSWALVLAIQAYTSGIGFQVNHLGPSVVMAGGWFMVALVRLWPQRREGAPEWRHPIELAGAVAMVVLLLTGMGFVREPRRAVPEELDRYIAQIEEEFRDLPANDILVDVGSWIYLRENVVMKDRSGPVSLHVGTNQPEINRDALAATIDRIESHRYKRILARELDTPRTAYDFQDRGSGVKAAMLENYRIVRRIPGVTVNRWWPRHMIADIVVLEPR